MKLIVGLGNIGKEYEKTVHNAGFMVIDALAEMLNVKFSKRACDADYAEVNINGEKFILAKPRTYMNSSGISVKSFLKKFQIDIHNTLIISDDIDLEPGKIRIRKTGSAGTHNGLKSIINETGEVDFLRVRVGVGKPQNEQDLVSFVLSKLFMSDKQKKGIENATKAVYEFMCGATVDEVMTKFNGA